MLYLIAFLIPASLIAVAIPLVLGIVPPNRVYGFRTPKTLSSPAIWYPVNRMSGWWMIAGGSTALLVNAALVVLHPEWPAVQLQLWTSVVTALAGLFPLVPVLLFLRRR